MPAMWKLSTHAEDTLGSCRLSDILTSILTVVYDSLAADMIFEAGIFLCSHFVYEFKDGTNKSCVES